MGKDKTSKVEQKRIPFADLVFMEDNPRRISETDFEALVASIRKDPAFFDNRPCLVNYTDGKYLVYAGFQRAHAAHLRLGWQEIPCSIEADVPEATMRERAIRDNTHQGTWDSDVLSSWGFEVPELREFGVPEFVFGEVDGIDPDELGTDFELPEGDRAPFQQITFTLADEQAKVIQQAVAEMKKTDEFKYSETYGNENGNGNALYLIVQKWEGLRTSF